MHYVNKVKGYLNFHINNFKLLKYEIELKLYSQVNNIMNLTKIESCFSIFDSMNNIDYELVQQATCKLKMAKCN